jgi:transposase
MKQLSSPTFLRFQGIDVSKSTFDVAWWGDQPFQGMDTRAFPRTPAGVRAWLALFPASQLAQTGVVMESTGGYCKELAGWILEQAPFMRVSIVNPFQAKSYGRSLGIRNKTDRVDARMLAKFGEERKPGPWAPLSKHQEALRDLTRTRTKVKSTLVSYRNRLNGHVVESDAAKASQERLLVVLQEEIDRLERAIVELCVKEPSLAKDMELLMSIPGVGPITAGVVLGSAGDLRRFQRRGELCAFLGVSPRQFQSGTSVHLKTHMCRMGGKHARSALYMAALSMCRHKGPLGETYRRLVAAGKPPKAALGAIMRKLLVVMRAVVIQGTPYKAPVSTIAP